MSGGVNARILIIVWLVAGLVTTWGIRYAMKAWFLPGWSGYENTALAELRGPARTALAMILTSGAIFSAMFITTRMRGRK